MGHSILSLAVVAMQLNVGIFFAGRSSQALRVREVGTSDSFSISLILSNVVVFYLMWLCV